GLRGVVVREVEGQLFRRRVDGDLAKVGRILSERMLGLEADARSRDDGGLAAPELAPEGRPGRRLGLDESVLRRSPLVLGGAVRRIERERRHDGLSPLRRSRSEY